MNSIDAAKAHIETLLSESYYSKDEAKQLTWEVPEILPDVYVWHPEYRFASPRMFRFDYAVPAILCANHGTFFQPHDHMNPSTP